LVFNQNPTDRVKYSEGEISAISLGDMKLILAMIEGGSGSIIKAVVWV